MMAISNSPGMFSPAASTAADSASAQHAASQPDADFAALLAASFIVPVIAQAAPEPVVTEGTDPAVATGKSVSFTSNTSVQLMMFDEKMGKVTTTGLITALNSASPVTQTETPLLPAASTHPQLDLSGITIGTAADDFAAVPVAAPAAVSARVTGDVSPAVSVRAASEVSPALTATTPADIAASVAPVVPRAKTGAAKIETTALDVRGRKGEPAPVRLDLPVNNDQLVESRPLNSSVTTDARAVTESIDPSPITSRAFTFLTRTLAEPQAKPSGVTANEVMTARRDISVEVIDSAQTRSTDPVVSDSSIPGTQAKANPIFTADLIRPIEGKVAKVSLSDSMAALKAEQPLSIIDSPILPAELPATKPGSLLVNSELPVAADRAAMPVASDLQPSVSSEQTRSTISVLSDSSIPVTQAKAKPIFPGDLIRLVEGKVAKVLLSDLMAAPKTEQPLSKIDSPILPAELPVTEPGSLLVNSELPVTADRAASPVSSDLQARVSSDVLVDSPASRSDFTALVKAVLQNLSAAPSGVEPAIQLENASASSVPTVADKQSINHEPSFVPVDGANIQDQSMENSAQDQSKIAAPCAAVETVDASSPTALRTDVPQAKAHLEPLTETEMVTAGETKKQFGTDTLQAKTFHEPLAETAAHQTKTLAAPLAEPATGAIATTVANETKPQAIANYPATSDESPLTRVAQQAAEVRPENNGMTKPVNVPPVLRDDSLTSSSIPDRQTIRNLVSTDNDPQGHGAMPEPARMVVTMPPQRISAEQPGAGKKGWTKTELRAAVSSVPSNIVGSITTETESVTSVPPATGEAGKSADGSWPGSEIADRLNASRPESGRIDLGGIEPGQARVSEPREATPQMTIKSFDDAGHTRIAGTRSNPPTTATRTDEARSAEITSRNQAAHNATSSVSASAISPSSESDRQPQSSTHSSTVQLTPEQSTVERLDNGRQNTSASGPTDATQPVSGSNSTSSQTRQIVNSNGAAPQLINQTVRPIIELAERISRRETRSLRFSLNPEKLGRVEVEVTRDAEGHLSARFTAEQVESGHALAQGISHLRETLEQAGLHVDRLEVVTTPQLHAGASGHSEHQPHSQPDNPAPTGSLARDQTIPDDPVAVREDKLLSMRA